MTRSGTVTIDNQESKRRDKMIDITESYRVFRRDFRSNRPLSIMMTILSSMVFAIAAPVTIHEIFYNEPKINGYDKLSTATQYLNHYTGAEPAKAIGNVYAVVDAVKGMNPGEGHIVALASELKSLETKVEGVENPLFYEPVLSEAAKDVSDYLASHDQTTADLYLLGGFATTVTLLEALAVSCFIPSAAELAERNDNANARRRRQRYDNDLHNTQEDAVRNHDN
jgi:hypothetical protein